MTATPAPPSTPAETVDGSRGDVFIFHQDASVQVVTDFTPGQNIVQLVGFQGDFNTISHYFTQEADAAVLVLQDSQVVKFPGVNVHDIDAADFLFI